MILVCSLHLSLPPSIFLSSLPLFLGFSHIFCFFLPSVSFLFFISFGSSYCLHFSFGSFLCCRLFPPCHVFSLHLCSLFTLFLPSLFFFVLLLPPSFTFFPSLYCRFLPLMCCHFYALYFLFSFVSSFFFLYFFSLLVTPHPSFHQRLFFLSFSLFLPSFYISSFELFVLISLPPLSPQLPSVILASFFTFSLFCVIFRLSMLYVFFPLHFCALSSLSYFSLSLSSTLFIRSPSLASFLAGCCGGWRDEDKMLRR